MKFSFDVKIHLETFIVIKVMNVFNTLKNFIVSILSLPTYPFNSM